MSNTLMLTAWATGVIIFLIPMVAALREIRSLRRTGLPWRSGQSLLDALAIDAGAHRTSRYYCMNPRQDL